MRWLLPWPGECVWRPGQEGPRVGAQWALPGKDCGLWGGSGSWPQRLWGGLGPGPQEARLGPEDSRPLLPRIGPGSLGQQRAPQG